MRELSDIRMDIDRVDRQLVALMEERMALAEQVAEYKITHKLPVLDSSREAIKLKTVENLCQEPKNRQAMRELFEVIMAVSRKRQETCLQ